MSNRTTRYGKTAQSYDQTALVEAEDERRQNAARFAADQSAMSREMKLNLGMSGLLAGAQLAAGLKQTEQDKQNEEQLAELERRRDAGELGLEADELQLLERMQLDPVRAMATQQTRDLEAYQASAGDARSAADLQRISKTTQDALYKQFREAGLSIAKADLDEKRRELQELESRIAYKGQRQQQRIDSVTSALADAGTLAGQVMAGRSAARLDTTALQEAGFSPDEIIEIVHQLENAKTPAQRERLLRMYSNVESLPRGGSAETTTRPGGGETEIVEGRDFSNKTDPALWQKVIADTDLGRNNRRSSNFVRQLRDAGLDDRAIAVAMEDASREDSRGAQGRIIQWHINEAAQQ